MVNLYLLRTDNRIISLTGRLTIRIYFSSVLFYTIGARLMHGGDS